jgi:outer membrane murein-binding lipoprotein Lpp
VHARHRSHRGLLLTVLILAVAMTGCAQPDPSAELAARIDTLVDEVDALGEELAVVRSEVAAARDELAEVNDDARLTRELLAAGGPSGGEPVLEVASVRRVPGAAPEVLGPAFPPDFPVPEGLTVASRAESTGEDGALRTEVTALAEMPVDDLAAFFDAYLTPSAGYEVAPVEPASAQGAPSVRRVSRDVVEADGELVPRWSVTVELTGAEDGTTTLRLAAVAREPVPAG